LQTSSLASFWPQIYLITNDKINNINNYLELHLSKIYNRFSKRVKKYSKWNRCFIFTLLFLVISLSVYQFISNSATSLLDYMTYYYGFAKLVLIPLRRVLLVSLSILAVMFILPVHRPIHTKEDDWRIRYFALYVWEYIALSQHRH